MITKREFLGGAALTASTGVPVLSPARAAVPSRPGSIRAQDIAEAGLIYGLPIVMNYGIMYGYCVDRSSGQFKAPLNTIWNYANVFTYKDTAILRPNSDTPYSLLWLDLRAEPRVISVPAIDRQRYYSVMLYDGNAYNYGYIGTRTTGTDAGDYLVVGPEWNGATPSGIKTVFRSGTRFSLAAFRTQLFGPADLDNVKHVQAGYRCQPLSAYLKQPALPAPPPEVAFPKITEELANKNFFEYLDFAMQFAPAAPNEIEIRAQLATIGVGPAKTFNFADLPLDQKAEILIGMKQGQSTIDAAVAKAGTVLNGWNVSGLPGDSAHYNGDWLGRAAAAQAGIYGNSPEEAMYPFTRKDMTGKALSGINNYTMTFPADQLPPVEAFWSITMYDGKTQLLVKNPINRYLINTPMLAGMKKDADGSLTLYVQHKSPGPDRASNWLPAPAGPIYLVMRLYWPKESQPSILPAGKGTWQPPGVVLAVT
jgi:hypothetical protein